METGFIGIVPGIGLGLLGYITVSLVLYLIGKRLNNDDAIWAFVPFINLFLFFELADSPKVLSVLLMFVPLVNIVVIVWAWGNILEKLNRSKWEAFLQIIPGINFIYSIYLILKLR